MKMGNTACFGARHKHKDGTGLLKQGENDPAQMYFNKNITKMNDVLMDENCIGTYKVMNDIAKMFETNF
jgi:hypothetical protein